MHYDNITKENFKDYEDDLFKLIEQRRNLFKNNFENDELKIQLVDRRGNDYFEEFDELLSIGFIKLFRFSHQNNIYFLFCSSIVYENTFENRFKEYENTFIDVKKIDFIMEDYKIIVTEYFRFRNEIVWNTECIDLIDKTWDKKRKFLNSLLLSNNYKVVESYNPQSHYSFDTTFINLNYSINDQTHKHENIFCNNGFVLFEHILNEYVKTDRGRLSDIHFFYRSMLKNKPQYIHQPPERFKEWFNSEYDEDLGKIKTFNQVDDPDRRKHYSNALDWFKTQL